MNSHDENLNRGRTSRKSDVDTGKAPSEAKDKTRVAQTLARGLMVLNCFQTQRAADAGSGGKNSGRGGRERSWTSDASEANAPGSVAGPGRRGDPVELGITELASELALAPTVVSRLTTTLVEYGYLYQNPATRKYRLGLSAFTLGLAANPHLELSQASRPWMQQLARETRETISLTVVDPVSNDGICIASFDSPSQIKLTTTVGSIRPLHRGATRKVLLAFMPQEMEEDYLSRLELPLADERKLRQELEAIRNNGIAYSEEELDEGVFAVAAPILRKDSFLLGGISILAPVFRHDERDREKFAELVRTAAKSIGEDTFR